MLGVNKTLSPVSAFQNKEQKQEKQRINQNLLFFAKAIFVSCLGSALAALAIWAANRSTRELTYQVQNWKDPSLVTTDFAFLHHAVARGVNPNIVTKRGQGLMHIAARACNGTFMDFILGRRANPNLKNVKGETALYVASYQQKCCSEENAIKTVEFTSSQSKSKLIGFIRGNPIAKFCFVGGCKYGSTVT